MQSSEAKSLWNCGWLVLSPGMLRSKIGSVTNFLSSGWHLGPRQRSVRVCVWAGLVHFVRCAVRVTYASEAYATAAVVCAYRRVCTCVSVVRVLFTYVCVCECACRGNERKMPYQHRKTVDHGREQSSWCCWHQNLSRPPGAKMAAYVPAAGSWIEARSIRDRGFAEYARDDTQQRMQTSRAQGNVFIVCTQKSN